MRSVRLYKNTLKTFLDNKEEIAPNKPVWVRFYIYLTDSGKVRTEIFLDFYSKKTGEKVVNEGGFYHEFDVDLICDSATNNVLNIDEDYKRVGIGLVKFWDGNISPQIVFDEFKIDPK